KLPSGSTSSPSSANAPLSGLGGGGDGKACLVIAVVVIAALPIIVYAVDDDADPDTLARYQRLEPRFELYSGATSTSDPHLWAPLAGGRASLGSGALGLDASLESTLDPRYYGAADVHLLLRPPPKQHIEGALALGARRVV